MMEDTIMADAIEAIGGSERSESIVDKIKKYQKMALGGDVKFSLPSVFGNGYANHTVSQTGGNVETASFPGKI